MENLLKLISLENLQTFWTNVKAYFQPKLDKLNRKTWKGTEAEFETALAQGLIDETTIVVITDKDEEIVYMLCTDADIKALFPQYA